ncbi:MAG TPA: PKD domain-containing protein, partial [Thermoplasmata archaeon]|nr:PKD domain-containing protein [Thermoplasmata archaeon]
ATGASVGHEFRSAGNFTVVVTATDAVGGTANASEVVEVGPPGGIPLLAAIGATPASGTVPLTVVFNVTVTGGTPPYTIAWTFGEGSTGAGYSPSFTYRSTGVFTAGVTVTDANGSIVTNSTAVTVSGGTGGTPGGGTVPSLALEIALIVVAAAAVVSAAAFVVLRRRRRPDAPAPGDDSPAVEPEEISDDG